MPLEVDLAQLSDRIGKDVQRSERKQTPYAYVAHGGSVQNLMSLFDAVIPEPHAGELYIHGL